MTRRRDDPRDRGARDPASEARRAAEAAARDGYGKLLATVAARTRDIAAAEDALSEAFATALRVWPAEGAPERPEAWLLTVARRAAGSTARRAKTAAAAQSTLEALAEERSETAAGAPAQIDDRLRLLLVCAHPAIDADARAPLMLQCALGLDAARIARAYVVPAATMGQRLVRAKAKIRDAGVPFEAPEGDAATARIGAVLDAIYAAYGLGWSDMGDAALADEATYLARLVAALAPASAEARGLLSLILHCESRRPARRDADGRYVPLSAQDPTLWRRDLLISAEAALADAARLRAPGRFQTEAAIQSLHAQRKLGRPPPDGALLALYDALLTQTDAIGPRIARAAALAETAGPEAALAALDALPADRVAAHQPFWAARAAFLAALGRADAPAARDQAAALATDPSVAAHLRSTRRAPSSDA